ncbi:MAG: hypothetical protein ACKVH8_15460 [Pirellulales bacterium]|jgi:hypothetical protein
MKISKQLFLLAFTLFAGLNAANAQSLDLKAAQNECPYNYYSSGYCGHITSYQQHDENKCPLNILEGIEITEDILGETLTTEQMVQKQLEIIHEWEIVFWNSPENPEGYVAEVQIKEPGPLTTAEVEQSLMGSQDEESIKIFKAVEETFTTPDFDYYDYIARAQSALNPAELDGVASTETENRPQAKTNLSRKALLSAMAEVAQLKEDEAYLYAYDGLDPYGYEEYNCYFELSEAAINSVDLENESIDYTDDEAQFSVNPAFSSSNTSIIAILDSSSDEYTSDLSETLDLESVENEGTFAKNIDDNSLLGSLLDSLDPTSYINSMDLSSLAVQVSEVLEKGYLLIDLDTIERLDRNQEQASDYHGKVLR